MPEGVWTEEDHLRDRPGWAVALYRDVAADVSACGPVTLSVSRTAITFAGPRRGFAGARPTATGVRGHLDLRRRLGDDPRILRVSPSTRRLFVHQFRLTAPSSWTTSSARGRPRGTRSAAGSTCGTERPCPR